MTTPIQNHRLRALADLAANTLQNDPITPSQSLIHIPLTNSATPGQNTIATSHTPPPAGNPDAQKPPVQKTNQLSIYDLPIDLEGWNGTVDPAATMVSTLDASAATTNLPGKSSPIKPLKV